MSRNLATRSLALIGLACLVLVGVGETAGANPTPETSGPEPQPQSGECTPINLILFQMCDPTGAL